MPTEDRGDPASFPLIGWVASLPGVERRLRSGARVAGVGCGAGRALIELALAFPASTYHGFDPDPAMIETARVASAEAGVSERVTFEVSPAATFSGARYDLIYAVGTPEGHDAALLLMERIRRAVVAGGAWLLCDPGSGPVLRSRDLER